MTSLYVFRHGIAEDAARSGRDADRRLTPEGREKVRAIGGAMRRLGWTPQILACSPLVRARETADLLAEAFAATTAPIVLEPWVPEGDPAQMFDAIAALCARHRATSAAVVGHLPSAASFVAAALGSTADCINLHKGGVALLEFAGRPAAGRGVLEVLLRPRVLLEG